MSTNPAPEPFESHHQPASDDDHPALAAANAWAGLWLFGIYLVLYAGFMGLSAFAPGLMARTPFGGLNLAILYGMGLIATAVILAFVYMGICHRLASRHASGGRGR